METLENNLQSLLEGRWQWKSNQDPWSQSEEPQWESYPSADNLLLEKAYYNKQKEVDLSNHIISIEHMLQINKEDKGIQRPVRRIDWMEYEEMNYRNERYYETESPKPMNKIFGDLHDFVNFFSKRTPEIWKFSQLFKEIEESDDIERLNSQICPEIGECIVKEFHKLDSPKPIGKPLSAIQKMLEMKKRRNKEVLFESFQKIFTSFDEFYAQVLRAYTMNTFLYQNLNKYLREETWADLNDLLPYAFCLCKAFFNFKPALRAHNSQGITVQKSAEMTLYRGTALSTQALEHFQKSKVQRFSWHSITSTSQNKTIAEKFMIVSNNGGEKMHPVMFIIRVPMVDSADVEYVKYLDIKKYSVIPSEDEVILPPGSVFDLEEITKDKNGTITIKIQLKNNVKSLAYSGLIMPGTIQNEMVTDGKAMMMCLEGEELLDTMKSISGNRLIEEVEFCLCTFDDNLLEEVIGVLATLQRLDGVKFVSCGYQNENQMINMAPQRLEEFNISKLQISETIDFDRFLHKKGDNRKYWTSLESLEISFQTFRDIEKNGLCFQGLQNLSQLASLKIDFGGYDLMTDDKLKSLSEEGLQYLSQLSSLGLNLRNFSKLTDEGINCLFSQGIQRLTQLRSLNLDLSSCDQITDEAVNILCCQGLQHLGQLSLLNLNFYSVPKITDEGINSLCSQGVRYLTQLTSLNLNFSYCPGVTEKGAKRLSSQGLEYITQLESLSLNPSLFDQIINQEVKSLFQELKHPLQIKALELSFRDCAKITDEGMKSLCSQVLQHLTQLKSLDLDFSGSKQIKAEGTFILSSQGIRNLTQLTSLALNFSHCIQITDETVNNLCSQGLRNLPQLTLLNLKFKYCKQMTDEGLRILSSQGLQYVSQLTYLKLNFANCRTISDEGINTLCSQGLQYLTQLKSFNFNFLGCENVKDYGMNKLRSQGLQNIPKLSSFILNSMSQIVSMKSQDRHSHEILVAAPSNLIACQRVSNDSNQTSQNQEDPPFPYENCPKELGALLIRNLLGKKDSPAESNEEEDLQKKSKFLLTLQQRESLDLGFSKFLQVTDEEVNILCFHGLQPLTQLISLRLKFSSCSKITDEGMKILSSQGLQHLTQLTSLDLNFSNCIQITDEGLNNLFPEGLKNLTRLTSLHLSFRGCQKITDEGVSIICAQGLRHLTQLTLFRLNLSFCEAITDEGINYLCTQGLQNLSQLTSLDLGLHGVSKITNRGVRNQCPQGVQDSIQFIRLCLSFSPRLNKIKHEETNMLCFQGFQHLTQLTSLNLDFSSWEGRIDEKIATFSSQGLQYLAHLTSLSLSFAFCREITDKGIKNLCLPGLRHLTQLTSLNLDFTLCELITSDGVNILCSQALKYLTQLTFLNLNFSCCLKLTDEGLNSLCSEGIKNLPRLISLNVDFERCSLISLFTKSNINRILHYFGFRNVNPSIFTQIRSFSNLIWSRNQTSLKTGFSDS